MRYRSAAFALKSAHALAGVGSTHFPALGVDADALLSPAAVLYLLRFSVATLAHVHGPKQKCNVRERGASVLL